MNTHYLKITGAAAIPEPIELDHEYTFAGIVTTESSKKKSDGEGGFEYTHSAKFTSHIELQKGEKVIKGTVKGKNSQRVRQAIWSLQQNEGMTHINEEDFYDLMTPIIIDHLPELFHKYFNK